jgi:hypothetical protein
MSGATENKIKKRRHVVSHLVTAIDLLLQMGEEGDKARHFIILALDDVSSGHNEIAYQEAMLGEAYPNRN